MFLTKVYHISSQNHLYGLSVKVRRWCASVQLFSLIFLAAVMVQEAFNIAVASLNSFALYLRPFLFALINMGDATRNGEKKNQAIILIREIFFYCGIRDVYLCHLDFIPQ
jgi:hypothetical protein